MIRLGFALVGIFLLLVVGCRTVEVYEDGFADEEYIWEQWNVSTNRINIIEVEF